MTENNSNFPKNEREFLQLIEEIDNYFKKKDMPIFQRPIHAIREVCLRLKTSLRIAPPPELIIKDDYTGDSLSAHIHNWYEKKYGDRLKIHSGPGVAAILIKGDPWKIKFPLIYGRVKFVFDPNLEKYNDGSGIVKSSSYMIANPLRCIEGFTSEYAKSLARDEMRKVAEFFIFALEALNSFRGIKSKPFIPEAKADLDAAVDNFFSTPPHYGQSKWASLQFTEKLLKCFLKLKKISFPKGKKGHDLQLLSNLAYQNGLPPLPSNIINDIQSQAGIRYGEITVTLEEAIFAHHSSLKVCSVLAQKIKEMR